MALDLGMLNSLGLEDRTDSQLAMIAAAVKSIQTRRGSTLKVGAQALIENLCGGTFVVEILGYRGTKVRVVLRERIVPSRSRRAGIGTTWIVLPSSLRVR